MPDYGSTRALAPLSSHATTRPDGLAPRYKARPPGISSRQAVREPDPSDPLNATAHNRNAYPNSSIRRLGARSTATSGNVCPGDDAAESFVVGVVVAPDDVAADHAALFFVAAVVGAVEGEVPQGGELGFD